MTKYYFGYNIFNSNIFPVKWVEEDGKPVGGKPAILTQQVEITFDDYRNVNLTILSDKYPLIVVAAITDPPG